MKTTYEWKRDQLVPKAEKFANQNIKKEKYFIAKERKSSRWNRLFHGEMARLVKESGI